MNQEAIGKFIATCRKEVNMTQKELAEKLGVIDKTVSRWENGYNLPDISLFEPLCEILNIDVIELLNAKKMNEKTKEEVNNTVMNIVEISNKKIVDQKKSTTTRSFVYTVFISLIAFVLVWIFVFSKEKGNDKVAVVPQGPLAKYQDAVAVKEKSDGWVCTFVLGGYLHQEGVRSYEYDCYNLKHPELTNFLTDNEIISTDNMYLELYPTTLPRYSHNLEYIGDIIQIAEYFSQKNYASIITIEDLEGLELSKINKEEVFALFNQAIQIEKYETYGNYANINPYENIHISEVMNGYQWQLGYILSHGYISYVDIHLLIDGEYLVDIVENGNATNEQKTLYDTIQKIETYIMENQLFEVDSSLPRIENAELLEKLFESINTLQKENLAQGRY